MYTVILLSLLPISDKNVNCRRGPPQAFTAEPFTAVLLAVLAVKLVDTGRTWWRTGLNFP